jgi:hypothetical protein
VFTRLLALFRPDRARPAPAPRRPRLEQLEDRMTPDASSGGMVSQSLSSFVQSIPTPPDPFFLVHEYQGDWQEILLGQLAMQRASDPVTRLFGQILVTDHMNLLQKITPLLGSAGLDSVPP